MCVCALRSVQLCDPINRRPSGSSVHGILQARILEWVALSYSRGSSRPRDGMRVSRVSCTGRWFFTTAPPEKLLGSFNGPGPGGPESTIRKWKREPEGRRERERERERKKETRKERKTRGPKLWWSKGALMIFLWVYIGYCTRNFFWEW